MANELKIDAHVSLLFYTKSNDSIFYLFVPVLVTKTPTDKARLLSKLPFWYLLRPELVQAKNTNLYLPLKKIPGFNQKPTKEWISPRNTQQIKAAFRVYLCLQGCYFIDYQ